VSRLLAVLGAPKTATTALARAVAAHPQVAFSNPKEPYWYGSELEPLRRPHGVRTRADYLACFEPHTSPPRPWRGEASTLSLSSPDAVAQMNRDEPDALMVCVVRNPVEIVASFHMQMIYAGFEPHADLATAWDARVARREPAPPECPVPRLLRYDDIAALGSQVERVVAQVGWGRVHVIVYDDLASDMDAVLAGLAGRMELDGPLTDPGTVHPAMVVRSRRFARAVRSGPGRRAARFAKRHLPERMAARLVRAKDTALREDRARPELPARLRAELVDTFRPEVERLESLLGRSLHHWLALDETNPVR
jgi:hypothetical protein